MSFRLTLPLLLLVSIPADAAVRERLRDAIAERGKRAQALPPGTQVRRDVAYGSHRLQAVDVFRADAAVAGAPVIVMVHGGGWRAGDKASPGVVGAKASRWLPRGFLVVSVNYRMLPEHDVHAQAEDVARAVALVQARAKAWGGDPERVVLMGHSAGAHLAAWVSADPQRWRAVGLRPWLGTVALDGAALDVEAVMGKRHWRMYDDVFGADPAFWRGASPAASLRPGARPLLAVCSRTRIDDPCAQAHAFAGRARAVGARVEVLGQTLGHGDINRNLGQASSYTTAVERFMGSLDAEVARRLAPAR